MFKYPLAVTIDTNIFDAAKFDLCDTSPLKTLENYVKNGKIKVVLSDIVVRESKRHIADQVKKICGIMRKARAAALEESTEHLIRTIGLGEILRIVTNKDELISKGEEMFDDFLRTINTEILGADLIDVILHPPSQLQIAFSRRRMRVSALEPFNRSQPISISPPAR